MEYIDNLCWHWTQTIPDLKFWSFGVGSEVGGLLKEESVCGGVRQKEEMMTVSQPYRGQNRLEKEATTEAVETTISLHTELADPQNLVTRRPVPTEPVTTEPVSQMGIKEEGSATDSLTLTDPPGLPNLNKQRVGSGGGENQWLILPHRYSNLVSLCCAETLTNDLGQKGLLQLPGPHTQGRNSSQELQRRLERHTAYWLASMTCSACFFIPLAHSGLALSISIINQENSLKDIPTIQSDGDNSSDEVPSSQATLVSTNQQNRYHTWATSHVWRPEDNFGKSVCQA